VTPDQFRRSKEIFHAALKRPMEGRAAFVEEMSAGDAEVKAEVESLLASEEEAGGFLDSARLPTLPGSLIPEAPPTADLPTERSRIGPYAIVREIGRGGMGSVYLAERSDREYRGRVALKLVKRGMDTDFILQRFRAERQILASLNHPNIAKLLDGGTTDDGLPYFIMEYIEGHNLTDYCGSRNLSLRDRIGLFRVVCAAVQFAHRNLVVHRDIKPSNLMVTEDGSVKLLDFGLAKVLDPQKSGESFYQTVAGIGIFTPEYASPEQVRCQSITTATDIYSLGVVLYEILAGRHPYRDSAADPNALLEAVCETDPPLPSVAAAGTSGPDGKRLGQELRGDLDTIVMTALRKEPDRRYAGAGRLSDDLGRYLEGLPVSARADTLAYRAGKFVRRHRVSVASALLVFLSLVAGLGASLWQARVARREKAFSEKRFNEVRKLAGTVLFDLHDAIKPLPGSTPARALLVTTALDYLSRLAEDAGQDRMLLREIAAAYVRVGDVQGGLGAGSLGDTAGAIASYRHALAVGEALCAAPDADAADRTVLAEASERMSDVLWLTGDYQGSLDAARRAVAIGERLLAESPGDAKRKARLARAIHVLSDAQEETRDYAGAVESSRRELRLYEELSVANRDDASARSKVAVAHNGVGYALLLNGETSAAITELRKAVEMSRALLAKEPENADFQRLQAFALMDLGEARVAEGRLDVAVRELAESRATFEKILAADPKNSNVRRNLGSACSKHGSALFEAGQRAEGLRAQREAVAMLARVCEEDPGNAAARKEKLEAEERLARSETVSAAATGTRPAIR
jgi:non-specific serine/threonine protein kinase/serine/threonine-protein kinase